MAPTWLFTVASLTYNSAATSAFVAPRAIRRSTSCSRSDNWSIRAASARRGRTLLRNAVEHARRDLRIEPRRTTGDGARRGDEILGGRVLEDEPGCAGVERPPERIVVVERREHEHRRRRLALVEQPGRRHAVHPAHAHVHQDEIGLVGGDCRYDLVAVGALGDDLEAVGGREDAGDARAHDRLVVDHQHADHVARHLTASSLLGAGGIGRRASTRHPSTVA